MIATAVAMIDDHLPLLPPLIATTTTIASSSVGNANSESATSTAMRSNQPPK